MSRPSRALARTLLALLAVLATLGPSACATARIGARPRVEALPSLKVGQSTAADVLLAIGEPTGKGSARFQPGMPRVEAWSYEYTEIRQGLGSSDADIAIVVVFLQEGRYAGHLWFAGGPLHVGRR
jgi:hypothetical protein